MGLGRQWVGAGSRGIRLKVAGRVEGSPAARTQKVFNVIAQNGQAWVGVVGRTQAKVMGRLYPAHRHGRLWAGWAGGSGRRGGGRQVVNRQPGGSAGVGLGCVTVVWQWVGRQVCPAMWWEPRPPGTRTCGMGGNGL